ncbi:MAG: hypothetical protein RR286_08210 [Mucinivorans sp.]
MKPIKQIFRLLLLSVTVVVVCSCAKAPLEESGQQSPADGTPVELSVNLTASNMTQVITRAEGNESNINPSDVKVLVFNEANILLQNPITLVPDAEIKGFKPITSVLATSLARTFLVVANASTTLTSLTLTVGTTSLDNVKRLLRSPVLTIQTSTNPGDGSFKYTSDIPQPIFWATLIMDKGVNWKSAITSTGTVYGSPLGLARNIAKVSVRFASATATNKLVGGTLFKAHSSSYTIQPGQTLPDDAYTKVIYSTSNKMDESTNFCSANVAGNEITPLYGYDSDSAAVLIKAMYEGNPYYYRLDLLDELKNQLSLTPNYHFIVVISKINGYGYRSAREATENTASNKLEYKVIIEGGDDVVSNGDYYLSLDCSEYIMCQREGAPQNVNVGKLFYKMPAYFPTVETKDVTMATNEYVSLVNPKVDKRLPSNATSQDIIISLKKQSSDFETHQVSINFALGSLRHSLTVKGAKFLMSNGYERYDLGTGFSSIALTENPGWAFLSDASEWSASMNLISGPVATITTRVFLYLAPNATTSDRQVNFVGVKTIVDDKTNIEINSFHVSGRGFQNPIIWARGDIAIDHPSYPSHFVFGAPGDPATVLFTFGSRIAVTKGPWAQAVMMWKQDMGSSVISSQEATTMKALDKLSAEFPGDPCAYVTDNYKWRTPIKEEFETLNNPLGKEGQRYGMRGYLFSGMKDAEGNTVFLNSSFYMRHPDTSEGLRGYYWSSTPTIMPDGSAGGWDFIADEYFESGVLIAPTRINREGVSYQFPVRCVRDFR